MKLIFILFLISNYAIGQHVVMGDDDVPHPTSPFIRNKPGYTVNHKGEVVIDTNYKQKYKNLKMGSPNPNIYVGSGHTEINCVSNDLTAKSGYFKHNPTKEGALLQQQAILIPAILSLYDEYKARCYNDSIEVRGGHSDFYVHNKPDFNGFFEYIRSKNK